MRFTSMQQTMPGNEIIIKWAHKTPPPISCHYEWWQSDGQNYKNV